MDQVCETCGLYRNASSQAYAKLGDGMLYQGAPEREGYDVLVVHEAPAPGDFKLGYIGGATAHTSLKNWFASHLPHVNVRVASMARCQNGYAKYKKKELQRCADAYLLEAVRGAEVVLATCPQFGHWLYGGAAAARNQWTIVRRVPEGNGFSIVIPSKDDLDYDPGLNVYSDAVQSMLVRHFSGEVHLSRYTDPDKRFGGKSYISVQEPPDFFKAVEFLKQHKRLAYDIEGTSLSPYRKNQRVISIAVSWAPGKAIGFLCEHRENKYKGHAFIRDALKDLFSTPGIEWCAHNGKFDSGWLYMWLGIDVFTQWDSMLMHGLFDENTPHRLKLLTQLYTHMGQYEDDLDQYMPKREKSGLLPYGAFEEVPVNLLLQYNCADADLTLELTHKFEKSLKEIDMLEYHNSFVPHDNWATGWTERAGVYVNQERIAEVRTELETRLADVTERLYSHDVLARYTTWKENQLKSSGLVLQHEGKLYSDSEGLAAGNVMWDPKCKRDTPYTQQMYNHFLSTKVIRKNGLQYKSKVYELSDCQLDLNSPQALRQLFFGSEFLNHPVISETKKGQIKVDKVVLGILAETEPLAKDLLEYRKLTKFYSTYSIRYAQAREVTYTNSKGQQETKSGYIHDDGLVHGTYLITGGNDLRDGDNTESLGGTRTRRKSCIDPNMTNQPKRGDDAEIIQSYYESRYGNAGKIVCIDYSQLELRVFAIHAQARFMLDSFNAGKDLHYELCLEVFNPHWVKDMNDLGWFPTLVDCMRDARVMEPEDLAAKYDLDISVATVACSKTSSYRSKVKNVWFGLIYGAGIQTTAKQMDLPVDEAQGIMDTVFQRIPEYNQYMDMIKTSLDETCSVVSMVGARRVLHNYKSNDRKQKAKAIRQGGNFPIQSAGSDMLTASGILVQRWLKAMGWWDWAKLVITIHDSLIFDCHNDYLPYIIHGVPAIMENLAYTPSNRFWFLDEEYMHGSGQRTCPTPVDVEIGTSWAKIRKIHKKADWMDGNVPAEVYASYQDSEPVKIARDMVATFV